MHRLLIVLSLAGALFALSASVAGAEVPVIGIDDACAAPLVSELADELLEAVTTDDAAACGGGGIAWSPCTWVPYVGWVQLYWNGYYHTTKPCIPGNA